MPSRGEWTRRLPLVTNEIIVDLPLTLGVIADTHASPMRGQAALAAIEHLFQRLSVGLIVHAGDVGHQSVLDELVSVAPVVAVRGNADPPDLISSLPDHLVIQAGPMTILVLHGHRGKTARQAARAVASPDIDLIIYGHSHRPMIEREGATILFNPGSPVERRWNPHFGVGLVELSEDGIKPELVLFTDPAHLANIER
ncbi:MAG: metallophosphoesterase family protein [Thermomicrobiales bacterium]